MLFSDTLRKLCRNFSFHKKKEEKKTRLFPSHKRSHATKNPGVANRTFGNRTQSNAIARLGSVIELNRTSLPFGRGSRVTSRGSRVNCRGSRVNGPGSKNYSKLFSNYFLTSSTQKFTGSCLLEFPVPVFAAFGSYFCLSKSFTFPRTLRACCHSKQQAQTM